VIVALIAAIAGGLARPSIALAQATCSSTESIACGEVKAGNITAVGQTDCFTFTAEAGEVVNLLSKAVGVGSSIEACSQLRGPSGNIIGADACGQPSTITLPATGTYTIRLFDQSNDETGAYNVQVQVLSATTSSCPVATVPCGATPGGILGSIVQSNTYRFVATEADEVVSITVADVKDLPFEACWQLYAADGSPLGTLECAEATRTLPAAGVYTVRVFDVGNDATGTYFLDVTVLSATAAACPDAKLACGEIHAGNISGLADNDAYWITTTSPNEVVDITTATTSGTMKACWVLYDADGTPTGATIVCGHQERVVTTPGTYVLRVFDQTYAGVGTYDVSAMTVPACLATPTPTPTPTTTATASGAAPGGSATPTSGTGTDATATPIESGSPGGSPGGTATPGGGPTSEGTPNGAGTETPGGAGTGTPGTGGIPTSTIGPPFGTPTPLSTPSIQNLEAALDDFLCYATKLTRGGPRFTPALAVRLNDTLGSTRFNVRKPTRLCAPADKDGNGIVDPIANLERYTLQRMRGTPRYARSTRRVVTALGTLSLDTIRPDQLLVPTAESAVAQPTALDAASHHVDNYKCYQVRVTRKTPKLPLELQVTVTDLLSRGARRLKVKSPTRLCVATDKEPEGVENPSGHLLCYPVKPVRGEPKHVKQRGLYLGNDLGSTRLDTLRESELCMPALLLP
jgi:hypothetical protein